MEHTVTVYSTQSCHFCHMVKDFFKEHNVQFTDHDVAADIAKRQEMVQLTGQLGVPVIVIDGKDPIIGFNQPLIASKLGL